MGLQQVAHLAKPDTILTWYRRLAAEKFDGSKQRRTPGRPRISREIEDLVVRMARENSGWGYDRIVGALANLGYQVSDQTVGNILRRHRFLHGRGADLARTGDVLCPIFHSSGQPEGLPRWHHRSSGGVLDASGGLQRDILTGWGISTAVATCCTIAMPSSALKT